MGVEGGSRTCPRVLLDVLLATVPAALLTAVAWPPWKWVGGAVTDDLDRPVLARVPL